MRLNEYGFRNVTMEPPGASLKPISTLHCSAVNQILALHHLNCYPEHPPQLIAGDASIGLASHHLLLDHCVPLPPVLHRHKFSLCSITLVADSRCAVVDYQDHVQMRLDNKAYCLSRAEPRWFYIYWGDYITGRYKI